MLDVFEGTAHFLRFMALQIRQAWCSGLEDEDYLDFGQLNT